MKHQKKLTLLENKLLDEHMKTYEPKIKMLEFTFENTTNKITLLVGTN